MDIYNLKGSKSRDEYRYIHKQKQYYSSTDKWKKSYACDIDLSEIRNNQVFAFTDVKVEGSDEITWAEAILYEALAYKIAPVFIVWVNPQVTKFKVRSYPDDTLLGIYNNRRDYFQNFIEKIGE